MYTKLDKMKHLMLKYVWERQGGPEWEWLKEELQVTEADMQAMFKYMGYKKRGAK